MAVDSAAAAERRFTDVAQLLYRQVVGSRFLRWKGVPGKNGRLTKKPSGSTLQPADWASFDDLGDTVLRPDAGVGLVLNGGITHDGYTLVVVDMDAAVDPVTGSVQPWALEVLDLLGQSFTTVSVSGTGLHAYLLVKTPPTVNSKFDLPKELAAPGVDKTPNVQLFALRGFVTVSCNQLPGTGPGNLEYLVRHEDLRAIYERFGQELPTPEDMKAGPVGEGPVPTAEEIRTKVIEMFPRSELLLEEKLDEWLEGKTDEESRDRSTSAQFFVLAQYVLIAARGHLDAATDFLCDDTPWGVQTSSDDLGQNKYDRNWIEQDLRRAWARGKLVAEWKGRRDSASVFDVLEGDEVVWPVAGAAPAAATLFVDFGERYRRVREGDGDGVLVPGLLARGRITNVAAAPKAGKSTWITAALVGFASRTPRSLDGFGGPSRPLRTLYLSENHPDDDAVTVCSFGLAGLDDQAGGPGCIVGLDQAAIPSRVQGTWSAFLGWVAGLVRDNAFDVVVFDTLEKWIPDLEDSNAAAQTAARFNELSRIVAQGCNVAVVCVLHVKKQGGPTLDFDAMLGSTKFRASSDINLMLVRHRPDDPEDLRIVVRREMRDPWSLVKSACGRLPDSVATAIRQRGQGGPARLCYRVTGEIKTDAQGQEFQHLTYKREEVPAEWSTPVSPTKLSRADQQKWDDRLVLHAAWVHSQETDGKPISARRLIEPERLGRVLESFEPLPPGYEIPGESRVRSATSRLIAAKALIQQVKGVTVAPSGMFDETASDEPLA
ncbi:MAG: AAA family ATPase [Planctomycetes bacterium]|nr:AAA family ATPase [Planctomycetota bacterium]